MQTTTYPEEGTVYEFMLDHPNVVVLLVTVVAVSFGIGFYKLLTRGMGR